MFSLMLDNYKLIKASFWWDRHCFGNTVSIELILKEAEVGSEIRFPYLLENILVFVSIIELHVS